VKRLESWHRIQTRGHAEAFFFDIKGVEIPVGVTVFPDELYPAPQSWAEKAYPKLVHYNRVEEGGHFAAWEQPQILSQELRDTFRSLR
jgi:pimeloyl-ACP methyl ester carboxylesterase